MLGGDGASGVMEINAELAWGVDPWIWTESDGGHDQKYQDMGLDAPIVTYINRDYQVSIFDSPGVSGWPDMWHLSFKRRDREPLNDWRIKQRIKDTIIGPENEGVELHPADSRLVDTANQYHLWVFKDPEVNFPFGFQNRYVTSLEAKGTKQRPHGKGVLETGPVDI